MAFFFIYFINGMRGDYYRLFMLNKKGKKVVKNYRVLVCGVANCLEHLEVGGIVCHIIQVCWMATT